MVLLKQEMLHYNKLTWGNSRFTMNSLISSSTVFQDLIIKLKEYSPFIITIIFFSKFAMKEKKKGHFQLHQKYEKSYTYKILILPIVLVSSGCLKEQHLLNS